MGNQNHRNANSRRNSHVRRDRRRLEAKARQTVRKRYTAEQQLAHLDALLGPGLGAVKERKRLTLQVTTKSVPVEKPVQPEKQPKGNPKHGARKNMHRVRPKNA